MRLPPRYVVLVLCLATAAFAARVSFIRRTSPYPLQTDEALIATRAAGMVERGDLSPHFFKYPSLPIYLTAASYALTRDADSGDHGGIGRVSKPFYTRPDVAESARILFAALSVLTLILVGLLGVRAFREPALLFLAPLLLLVSDRYLLQSWMYLNVDIVGATVCSSALTFLFFTRERSDFIFRALLPGLMVGLAVGSKYYLGLVGLPFALVLFEKNQRPHLTRNLVGISLATVVGFLLTTPYALLDRQLFLEQVIFEIDHYSSGHRGGEGEPGFAQFFYYLGQMIAEFGWGGFALMLLGLMVMFKRDRSTALLFVSFPVVLLLFLCTQRVHFPRNLTSIYALIPVASGLGLITLFRSDLKALGDHWRRIAGPLAAIVVLIFGLPWSRVQTSYRVPTDSRKLVLEWLNEHRQDDLTVYVADELQMDVRPLQAQLSGAGSIELVTQPLGEFIVPGMKQAYQGQTAFFIVPEIVPGSRFARSFAQVMKPAQELVRRARFGHNPVPRVTTKLIHMGDPRLVILGLDSTDPDE